MIRIRRITCGQHPSRHRSRQSLRILDLRVLDDGSRHEIEIFSVEERRTVTRTPGVVRAVIKLARPPATLRVELDRRASKIVVDGAVVATGAGVGPSTVAGTAVFGDQEGCGAAPQAATRWRALRLAP